MLKNSPFEHETGSRNLFFLFFLYKQICFLQCFQCYSSFKASAKHPGREYIISQNSQTMFVLCVENSSNLLFVNDRGMFEWSFYTQRERSRTMLCTSSLTGNSLAQCHSHYICAHKHMTSFAMAVVSCGGFPPQI